jgi:hypothetical protein
MEEHWRKNGGPLEKSLCVCLACLCETDQRDPVLHGGGSSDRSPWTCSPTRLHRGEARLQLPGPLATSAGSALGARVASWSVASRFSAARGVAFS